MPTSTSEGANSAPDRDELRRIAAEEGFDTVGFASADFGELPGRRLDEFIAAGRHGDMDWIVEKAHWRRHPQALWPEARSVIVLGLNYGPEENPAAHSTADDRGVISVYAQGRDYHDVMKKKLKSMARRIVRDYGGDVKVFVDTAPVMEKPLAAAAGLGWQGKHTNLVSREFGSWLFLGSIYTTHELPPDAPGYGGCGSCSACLDICPTAAFPAPYQLDARRCISYLTIETRAHIPREMRPLIGNRIYGCDDCLAVCPWNKYAKKAAEISLAPRPELRAPELRALAGLDDPSFRELFSRSPVKRLGRNRFVRNVLIAIGNSGRPDYLSCVAPLLEDASPIVRVAAVWALGRIVDASLYQQFRGKLLDGERDRDVREEWDQSCSGGGHEQA